MLLRQGVILGDGAHLSPESPQLVLPNLTFHCIYDHASKRTLIRKKETAALFCVCYCHFALVHPTFLIVSVPFFHEANRLFDLLQQKYAT